MLTAHCEAFFSARDGIFSVVSLVQYFLCITDCEQLSLDYSHAILLYIAGTLLEDLEVKII